MTDRLEMPADGRERVRVLALGRDVGTCFGGAEKVAFELLRRLDVTRFDRYLCTTHVPAEGLGPVNARELDDLTREGVKVLRLERRSLRSNLAWTKLYRLLVDERIDILHAHMPRASVPGAVIGRLAKVPVVVAHEHGWSFRGKPVRRFLDRNVVARLSDTLLAVSEWDRRHISEVERIDPAHLRVLANGIPPMETPPSDLHGELRIAPDVKLIGSVGRLYPEKGYSELIEAVSLVKRDPPCPFKCLILGTGPEESQLRDLAARLHVEDCVQLLGWRDDVPGVVGALDVAISSSRNEGSPLAIMEYMACAAPIVATAVGGVPELIEDGVHGVLVAPRDPVALAAAIRGMLRDPASATMLGEAARERQRSLYDLEGSVRELEAIYLELYARARRDQRAGSFSATTT